MVCRAAHSGHNAQLEQRLEQGSNVSQALIAALQNPALYPHPVEGFQVIETHISWVLLTGPYAYKIKKPVNFGFLDFTELDARRHFCEEELRLNQRLTQDLYLQVLPIGGSEDAPSLDGSTLGALRWKVAICSASASICASFSSPRA